MFLVILKNLSAQCGNLIKYDRYIYWHNVSDGLCNIGYFSGALKIPSHISVLHVEQEVVGDDTEAVDSVLECDTERYELLQKEKELTQLMNLRYMYDIFRDENLQLFGKFHFFFQPLSCWINYHAYFQVSANQITWSWLLIWIHIINGKQCRSRPVGFSRSQLIWIYTVCKGRTYPGSAGLGLSIIHGFKKFQTVSSVRLF